MTDVWGIVSQYVSGVVSAVLVVVILSGRREARATLSWLLAVIFLPWVGVLFYLVFGNPRIKNMVEKKLKKRKPLRVRQFYNTMSEYEDSSIGKAVEVVTGVKPQLCRDFEVMTCAEEKYYRLEQDIRDARHYIFLEYYVFRRDDTGKRLLKLLDAKVKEGVKVFLLYDGIGAFGLHFSTTANRLRKSGGKVVPFLSFLRDIKTLSKVNFRNHRKIAVIDGNACYTGGINIGDEYLGLRNGTRTWYDVHIRFSGDAVHTVEQIFAEDWQYATGEDLSDLITARMTESGGDTTVQIIPSGPDQQLPLIYDTLFTAISRAKESVDIVTPYLVPDSALMQAIKNVARQGVRVRIMLPGKSNHPVVAAAGRSYYEELMEAGVEIFETTKSMLHAKVIIVDTHWITIGTTNMDMRSFRLNFELNVVVYSYRVVLKMQELVEEYLGISRRVELDAFRKRNIFRRIFEGFCRALSPVM